MKTRNLVLTYIKENNLINSGDTVICGLSGGADSCAMVHILAKLKDELGISVICAHLNHMIRGEEADRDMAFAKAFAQHLDLPFFGESRDIPAMAQALGISLEDAGRRARYDFFHSLIKTGCYKIATAHNKNDKAETVLMHIVRGCGVNGLQGIPPRRGEIIRPLLNVSRNEIEQYCRENDIHYITDSTNLQTDYTRNRFRLEVMPMLRQINPRVDDALCRLAQNAEQLKALTCCSLAVTAEKNEASVSLADLCAMAEGLYPDLLKKMLNMAGLELEVTAKTAQAVKKLVSSGKTTGIADLGKGITARLSYDKLIIAKIPPAEDFEYTLSPGKALKFPHMEISISETIPEEDDYLPICGEPVITLRNRRPGDKMKINGMTRKLQDMLVNLKVDRTLRGKLVIIAFDGNPVWAEKIGRSDTVKNVAGAEKYIVIKKSEA